MKRLSLALGICILVAGLLPTRGWAQETRGVYVTPLPGKEGGLSGETKIYDRSFAVVIGINEYRKIPKLEGAVRDARNVAEALKRHGMEVTTLLDGKATLTNIKEILGDYLPAHVRANDRVLVYFAGHGVTVGSGDKAMGYLMPVDGEMERPVATGLSMSEMQNWFAMLPSKHVMFVADACYSGLALATRATGLSPAAQDYLKQVTSKPVRLALVAGGAGEESHEWQGQGVFTRFFLSGIDGGADANADGLITSYELQAYIAPQVSQLVMGQFRSQQNPQMGRMGEGEFVFLNPAASKLRLGAIKVETPERGATILVDGRETGVFAPGVVGELQPGVYRVAVALGERRSATVQVEVKAGGESPVALTLPEVRVIERERARPLAQGSLMAWASRKETGETLKGEVWANGVRVGATGDPILLDPGVYNVEVRYSNQPSFITQARVAAASETPVRAVFSWPEPKVERVHEPDLGMSGLAKGGWSLVGIGAGMVAVMGGVFHYKAQAASDENKDRPSSELKDDFTTYRGVAVTGYVLGSAALATGIVLLIADAFGDNSVATASIPTLTTDGQSLVASWGRRW